MGMIKTALAGVFLTGIWGSVAGAETPNTEQPMLTHAEKAVTQPVKDLNLKKEKIPPRLLQIQQAPYDLTGLDGCHALTTEITNLYPMLGPDVNERTEFSKTEKRERGVSQVAGGILGGLIPFRGVVRELTGANASDRRYRTALSAGFARRSFLKGIAVNKGCIEAPNGGIEIASGR